MLDWIKQALGSFGEIQNKNGQEILEPLAQNWARLKRHGDDMPVKALAFVLAADSPVLGHSPAPKIAQQHPWIEALALDLSGNPLQRIAGGLT
jgi:hypothetical protein